MTIAVDLGRKAPKQTNKQTNKQSNYGHLHVLYARQALHFIAFSSTCLINLIIQEHLCKIFYAWVKVFGIFPEFRILRLTFHRKSASKC